LVKSEEISIERLTIKTKKILKQSGWIQERKKDISSPVKYLEDKGYVVFDCVREALEQFGELKCIYDKYYLAQNETINYTILM